MAGIRLGHQAGLATSLRVDPRVVLSSILLQFNTLELAAAVQQEICENPALQLTGGDDFEPTEYEIIRSLSPEQASNKEWDYEYTRSMAESPTEVDWLDFAPSQASLEDYLTGQIKLKGRAKSLVLYVAASLDDRGYLRIGAEDIASSFGASIEQVEEAIRYLQHLRPAGIGARSVVECLLLQIQDDRSPEADIARYCLQGGFDDFLNRSVRPIARKLSVTPDLVHSAFKLIESLNPYPAAQFQRIERRSSQRPQPEIIFARDESGWQLEIRGIGPEQLSVDRKYQSEADQKGRGRGYFRKSVTRANRFIDAVQQRQETLRKIGRYLVELQGGFLSTGDPKFLTDMTRTKLAQDLGLHESTVSRATQDKYVQLPSGELVNFDTFFDASLRIKSLIAEILQYENPKNPLSDERISQLLAEKGVHVARRTVNKYRDSSKMLSSRRRKSA